MKVYGQEGNRKVKIEKEEKLETRESVSRNILNQIGAAALMRLGAHQVSHYKDAVLFRVKLAKPGQARPRIMLAKIILTPRDEYDVSVGMTERPALNWYSRVSAEGVDAGKMREIMHELADRA